MLLPQDANMAIGLYYCIITKICLLKKKSLIKLCQFCRRALKMLEVFHSAKKYTNTWRPSDRNKLFTEKSQFSHFQGSFLRALSEGLGRTASDPLGRSSWYIVNVWRLHHWEITKAMPQVRTHMHTLWFQHRAISTFLWPLACSDVLTKQLWFSMKGRNNRERKMFVGVTSNTLILHIPPPPMCTSKLDISFSKQQENYL